MTQRLTSLGSRSAAVYECTCPRAWGCMPLFSISNIAWRYHGFELNSKTLFARRFSHQACSFCQLQGATEPADWNPLKIHEDSLNTLNSPLTSDYFDIFWLLLLWGSGDRKETHHHPYQRNTSAIKQRQHWPSALDPLDHWSVLLLASHPSLMIGLMWNCLNCLNCVLSFGVLSDEPINFDTKVVTGGCSVEAVHQTKILHKAGEARSRNAEHPWPVIRESVFSAGFLLRPSWNDMHKRNQNRISKELHRCTPLRPEILHLDLHAILASGHGILLETAGRLVGWQWFLAKTRCRRGPHRSPCLPALGDHPLLFRQGTIKSLIFKWNQKYSKRVSKNLPNWVSMQLVIRCT